uniref:Glutamine amidotransferase like class 1 domain containing 3A n=1 Tax=Sinocyclocheilus rhinocerous TaxID=307959 RepID=A0A673GWW7_9TELE
TMKIETSTAYRLNVTTAFHSVRVSGKALVLSGCGVYDGTEIHEASAILVHLSRGGAEVRMFAPDVSQMHVIDHGKGQPKSRGEVNVLSESARIARGNITDLAKLNVSNHDAVIFPGGFGAAKNLSTFAIDGKDCNVIKEVERVLKDFHKARKPIRLVIIYYYLYEPMILGRWEVAICWYYTSHHCPGSQTYCQRSHHILPVQTSSLLF